MSTSSITLPNRRGVLLLVVLSMLTLFLLLGVTYLVAAARARMIARTYSRMSSSNDPGRSPNERFLDAVLMTVLRGGAVVRGVDSLAAKLSYPDDFRFESLLADRYGSDQTISGSSTVSGTVGQLITASLSTGTTVHPALLNGRILSFIPPGREITTHRILRATGAGPSYTLTLSPPANVPTFVVPPANCPVVINGREFSGDGLENEDWDGFDMAANPFLAYLSLSDRPSQATCNKMSFIRPLDLGTANDASIQFEVAPETLLPYAADNDGDGEPDGVFLDFGFPPLPTSGGQMLKMDASVLIVDLDGRFNINAHGSLASQYYQSPSVGHAGWSTSGTLPGGGSATFATSAAASSQYVPLGIGVGPAEIDVGKLTFTHTYNPPPGENPWLLAVLGGTYGTGAAACQQGARTFGSRFTTGASTPRESVVLGRYAEFIPSGTAAWRVAGLNLTSGITIAPVGRPARSGTNDVASKINDYFVAYASATTPDSTTLGLPLSGWWTGSANATPSAAARAVYNSPPDVHGRMKVYTGTMNAGNAGPVPTLSLAKPEWGLESLDDPYEERLGDNAHRAGKPSLVANPADAMFTYAELEKILRPYDADSQTLAPRLAAALGSAAEEARLMVTTDSWDTTAITGSTAQLVKQWITASPPLPTSLSALYASGTTGLAPVGGILAGELARGERFDLARPLGNAGISPTTYSGTAPYYLQRQSYFKDLYTLLCALSSTAPPANHRDLAQWAANVVEFRDADSTMTPFEYDRNPRNGWTVDGNFNTAGDTEREVVFGAERPEMVITEAMAWRHTTSGTSGLFVVLHRPWDAKAVARVSGTNYVTDAEPCDPRMTSSGTSNNTALSGTTNELALGATCGNGAYPIWRLRIVAGGTTSIVRFDPGTSASGSNGISWEHHALSGTNSPVLGTNNSLVVNGNSTYYNDSGWKSVPVATGTGIEIVTASTSDQNIKLPTATATEATIYLERLADPAAAISGTTWSANLAVTGSAMASGTAAGMTVSPTMYRIVDSITCNVQAYAGNGSPTNKAARRMTDPSTSFWKGDFNQSAALGAIGDATQAATNVAWFHWPNRPLTSPLELLLVRNGDAATMLDNYYKFSSGSNSLRSLDSRLRLLDAVTVPTKFAGIHTTVPPPFWTAVKESETGIYASIRPVNQLSSYREPGRVNLNTIVGFYDLVDPARVDSEVWNAVVGGPLASPVKAFNDASFVGRPRLTRGVHDVPAYSIDAIPGRCRPPIDTTGKRTDDEIRMARSGTAAPAKSLTDAILTLSGTDTFVTVLRSGTSGTLTSTTNTVMAGAATANPYHSIYTAQRLGNTATVRSNVFAIWVTLRVAMPGDPDSVRLHRAFYIVDRSIPVAYQEGRDHNVSDMIRLRRIIE